MSIDLATGQLERVRIIFFGTASFAVPVLDTLFGAGFSVEAVVTKPDEPAGRKQLLTPPPMKVAALKHHIPVFQPVDLKSNIPDFPEADLFIVAAYGKIIPSSLLAYPRLGALNIHPSLLPRWRGPSPVQFAILHGDTEFGVSIMQLDELMDHGPLLAQEIYQSPQNRALTYPELNDILWQKGAALLARTLPRWLAGEIQPTPQNDVAATFSKLLKKSDGRIKWSRPAEEIERMVRAFMPWPGTWTLWPTADRIYRIRIEEARAISDEAPVGSHGYVWQPAKGRLAVNTSQGSLELLQLTMEGKRPLTVDAFLRGFPEIAEALLV